MPIQKGADSLRVEAGDSFIPVIEVCRKMGMSEQTFYVWRWKYGGIGATVLRKARVLEEESAASSTRWPSLPRTSRMLREVLAKRR